MKVLNLYAGIGGNRKLWPDYCEVTAVENDPEIAAVYESLFREDIVIVGDAKEYLLNHFQEFDFIWVSPPCPTHSRFRMLWKGDGKHIKTKISGSSFKLPDMDLYAIIIFLKHFYEGKWVVENVISYYDPLIKPQESENHYFWCNFSISKKKKVNRTIRQQFNQTEKWGFDLKELDLSKRFKKKLLNNMVNPTLGLHIFNMAFKEPQTTLKT